MAKGFKISARVAEKLRDKHGVTRDEVIECFMNREGPAFEDTRTDHVTNPPTFWFMSYTDKLRYLKIVYVEYPDFFAIKSAFEPTDNSPALYEELCSKQSDH